MTRAIERSRVMLLVVALVAGAAAATADTPDEFTPPSDYPEGWYARIETSHGRIVAMLHPDQAPQSVAHFAGLAGGTIEWTDPASGKAEKTPYYDGIEVSLARAGNLFVIGYRPGTSYAPDLHVPPEGRSPRGFERGFRLGMTQSGAGISGVVFFITVAPNRSLDGKYPCFGTVVTDPEVLHRIAGVTTQPNGRPVEPVTIEKIRIFSVGSPPPLPAPAPYTPQLREMKLGSPPKG